MGIDQTTKILIILQTGTESHGGCSRALQCMLHATDLGEAGATGRLAFGGALTEWLARGRLERGPGSRAAGPIGHARIAPHVGVVLQRCIP